MNQHPDDEYHRFMMLNIAFLTEAFHEAHGRFPVLLDRNISIQELLDTCCKNRIVLQADYKPQYNKEQ